MSSASNPIFFKKPLTFFIVFVILLQFATPAQANPQCGQRFIAQNIKSAVLAYKATKYCKSTKLPYSRAQASKNIDSLRCNAQASLLLDELIYDFDAQYKSIMSGAGKQVVCLEAAALGKDIS